MHQASHSLRRLWHPHVAFVPACASSSNGMPNSWASPWPSQVDGVNETATLAAIKGDQAPGLKVGDVEVKIDPRYFRPTEVETLLGDPSKAKFGWTPELPCSKCVPKWLPQTFKKPSNTPCSKQIATT